LVYASTGLPLNAQTVVAHATSLGVAFVSASLGTWRYARARAVLWGPTLCLAVPGIGSAFFTARILTRVHSVQWVRALFAVFLLVTAIDLVRRARGPADATPLPPGRHSVYWLIVIGLATGAISALLGIGGGLIAVPALLYVGRLPVRSVAPTALAGVCLTTSAGTIGYLTSGAGPSVSPWMVGFIDLHMAIPLAAGAMCTIPLGVHVNRRSQARTLYRLFALVFGAIGLMILWPFLRA
jgi:uncharacterized membrane protein YfcA